MQARLVFLLVAGLFGVGAFMRGQAAAIPTPPGIVLAATVAGTVTMTVDGITTELTVDAKVPETAKVVTGADSRAVLVFSNGSLAELGPDTELVLERFLQEPFGMTIRIKDLEEEPSVSQTTLVLSRGEVTAKVKKLRFARGSSFTVRSPVGAAGLRTGGEFQMRFRFSGAGPAEFLLKSIGCRIGFAPPPGGAPPPPQDGATGDDTGGHASGLEEITLLPGKEIKVSVEVGQALPRSSTVAPAVAPATAQSTGQAEGAPTIAGKTRLRPALVKTVRARPSIVGENRSAKSNLGPTAVDARWSNHGTYLQRMIDTVQIQWERIILEQRANPASGSMVNVKFVMNDEGRIISIGVEETTANEEATRACVSAITHRMPYGPWTEEMKAALGNQQEMTFRFQYQ